ncbi:transketolase family protein [Candidatus Margulisiibacteriota bacterium]
MSEMLATRDAYGKTLVELGKETKDIVVLDADLSASTRTAWFAKEFPERFINAGVAEQNLIGMAAGLALSGKTVFASSFAMFCTGRPWEMIRNSIAYPNLNVKIVSTHAGITVGEDGASHQANEDIAIMRAIPNMTIVIPGDAHEAAAIIRFAAKTHGPWYIRLSRSATPVINDAGVKFDINDTPVLRKGKDVTIVASGIMIKPALDAADALAKDGIEAEVLNLHTIKPMPVDPIISSIKKTGLLVTAEEHNLSGGIGSAIAQQIVLQHPVPMEMVGLKDTFCESGKPAELLEKYKLNSEAIIKAVNKGLPRKSA